MITYEANLLCDGDHGIDAKPILVGDCADGAQDARHSVVAEARRHGWKFDHGMALCPKCAGQKSKRKGLRQVARLLEEARAKADAHSTLTGDTEVTEIYDLINEAFGIVKAKTPWNFQ